jgi:hypothetical protein
MREPSRYYTDADSQQWAARALSSLCTRHEGNRELFSRAGGTELIADAVLRFSGDSTASGIDPEAVLTLVATTTHPDEQSQLQYARKGCITSIVGVLGASLDGFNAYAAQEKTPVSLSRMQELVSIIEAALKAIRGIAEGCEEAITACYACKAERTVLAATRVFGVECLITSLGSSIQSVTQWSLFTLCSLGANEEYLAVLSREGACDIVSTCLLKQVTSAPVAQWASHTVGKLAQLAENAIRLEEAWVCRGLSLALTKHVADDDVVEEVTEAIVNLCKRYDKNRTSLSSVSTCEHLYAAAKRNMQNEVSLEHILSAVAAMASPGQKDPVTTKLAQVGFCKIISRAIKTYTTNSIIAKAVFQCIYALSTIPEYAKELGTAEFCQAIAEAVACQAAEAEAVCLFLHACISLCTYEQNIKRLGSTSIPKWVISLIDHCMDNESIVYIACHTLSELANDPECCEKLGTLQGCQMLINIISGYRKNELITSYACRTVGKLACNSKKNAQRFTEDGVCIAISVAAETHIDRDLVCQFVCDAITGVATNFPPSR